VGWGGLPVGTPGNGGVPVSGGSNSGGPPAGAGPGNGGVSVGVSPNSSGPHRANTRAVATIPSILQFILPLNISTLPGWKDVPRIASDGLRHIDRGNLLVQHHDMVGKEFASRDQRTIR
jgi:hypothetical protein